MTVLEHDARSPASRPQLTKLAICFTEAGVTDRAVRLGVAMAFVDRPIESSTELTRAEAHRLIDALERGTLDLGPVLHRDAAGGSPGGADQPACAPTPGIGIEPGTSPAPAPETEYDPASGAGVPPHPDAIGIARGVGCGPGGLHWLVPDPDRTAWCACRTVTRTHAVGSYCLAICWCGRCPQYVPPAEPNWRRIKSELAEAARQKAERKWRR